MSKEVKKKASKKKATAPAPVVIKPDKNKEPKAKDQKPNADHSTSSDHTSQTPKAESTKQKTVEAKTADSSSQSEEKAISVGKTPVKIKDFRWLKITGICFGLFIGFSLLSALIFNSTNSAKLTNYKTSKEFKAYSASLNQYLTTNNAVYTRTFTCSASLDELWNPGTSPISKKVEPQEVQLARQLIDLKPKWEAVSKTFPAYSSFFIFKVLPFDHSVYKDFQNTADLIDRSGALVNHTEDFGYYCPGRIYPGVSIFDYLNEYSKDQPVNESVATINQRMKALVDAGNDFNKSKTPVGWQEVRTGYIAFMKQTLADLTTLRNETIKNPGKVNMHTQFANNKKELEKVLAKAKEAGKKIGPNQTELTKLYVKVTAE